jgi:putative colanic acid biosynthesis UDP-glucose lipid carrier transferase
MLATALAVRVSSPGPIIFRQRRYGLYGEEIIVYKFRSMTVAEDGDKVVQARRGDQRVTKVGGFLRRTSLDELPQFINVLQGRMSIVGPRPHAVAHNEQYRKLIKGYMLRHKVKPGITGWAQVNGLRGETATLDRMEARIQYDLDYLRNWSVWLDLWIILRTVKVVLTRENAF